MDNNEASKVLAAVSVAAATIADSSVNAGVIISKRRKRRRLEMAKLQGITRPGPCADKLLWTKAKATGWYDFVVPQMSEDDFVEHFRMTPAAVEILLSEIQTSMRKEDTKFRRCIPVRKRVLIGLKCLSSCSEYHDVAALFGVGTTTVQECFDDFVEAVNGTMTDKMIKWPCTDEEVSQKARRFEDLWQYPMCIGAIDGCHFPVSPPAENTTDYYNFKGWYSVIAFVASDADCRAMYVKAGMPGRANDSTIFRNSSLYGHIQNQGFPQADRTIQGTKIPYHLIGDSAFRLETFCLKPFPFRCATTELQVRFNSALSRARRVVENLFGRVKGRWRRVSKRMETKISKAADIITAAFTLHNFCEQMRTPYFDRWDQEVEVHDVLSPQPQNQPDVNENPSASEMRYALAEEFLQISRNDLA